MTSRKADSVNAHRKECCPVKQEPEDPVAPRHACPASWPEANVAWMHSTSKFDEKFSMLRASYPLPHYGC